MSGPFVMPIMKKVNEKPIMSFQTDKSGIFNPSFSIASGTLKWIIDGATYTTNSPSVVLTGSTVDVKIFANDVVINETVTSISFELQNIIGELDFSHFTISGAVFANTNAGLTNVIFSNNANSTNNLRLYNCNLSALDLTSFTLSGTFWVYSNPNMNNVIFSTNSNNSSNFRVYSCNLSALDLSNVLINGSCLFYLNPNLSSITLKVGANVSSNFRGYGCNFSSIDLSNIKLTGITQLYNNTLLSSITTNSYGVTLQEYDVSNCALNLAAVNGIFSSINAFMSSNAPISDLFVDTSGGTNASPTGGAANTDIVNLDTVVYPATIHDFTYAIS